ncbi:heavy-metal-associated domain-containing protein [uncultured Brevibacillus sp.]|uniref:heavy-metal-associated domain-containing protein n=1 Tax=uncultured Brevibacillus sp. TaxID=169970 RepID=UPI002594C62A|nr:cation transporter [uncultured Brevibacillus sp.]
MKKTYKLQNLDCANCISKIEDGIKKLPEVTDVKVNFMGQKLILEAPDDKFNAVFNEAKKIFNKFEPDVTIEA